VGEEEIDLEETNAALVVIEQAVQTATGKHNEFLKALGLPLLPSSDSNS
jgi:type I restriction enzyme M protein